MARWEKTQRAFECFETHEIGIYNIQYVLWECEYVCDWTSKISRICHNEAVNSGIANNNVDSNGDITNLDRGAYSAVSQIKKKKNTILWISSSFIIVHIDQSAKETYKDKSRLYKSSRRTRVQILSIRVCQPHHQCTQRTRGRITVYVYLYLQILCEKQSVLFDICNKLHSCDRLLLSCRWYVLLDSRESFVLSVVVVVVLVTVVVMDMVSYSIRHYM